MTVGVPSSRAFPLRPAKNAAFERRARNGKGAFTHTSYNDFEIVASNLLDNKPRSLADRIGAYALS